MCEVEGCNKAFSNASDRAKHQNRTHSSVVSIHQLCTQILMLFKYQYWSYARLVLIPRDKTVAGVIHQMVWNLNVRFFLTTLQHFFVYFILGESHVYDYFFLDDHARQTINTASKYIFINDK